MDCPCGSSFFSVLAVLVAIGLYFALRDRFGVETLSWMCILGAAPCAALGFIHYHGMTAEQLLWTYVKSEFLMPKRLVYRATNIYYEVLHKYVQQREQGE